MRILVTGSSRGIGKAVAEALLHQGDEVIGLDLLPSSIDHPSYRHFICDIASKESLPELEGIEAIFHNAGKQNSEDDILNNLVGTMNVQQKYGFQKSIQAILFNASASATSGQEFPAYCASKGGILSYMRNTAIALAPQGATVNAISLGGVLTESNTPVMEDTECWAKIMAVTPLKKWTSLEEVADWAVFLLKKNHSMSGQNILIDNGEKDLNPTFVWPS